MRIERKKNKDERTLFVATLSWSELLMLYELTVAAFKSFPKHFETSPARNRLRDLMTKMGDERRKWVEEHGKGYKTEDFVSTRKH